MSDYVEKKYAALDSAIMAAVRQGKSQHCLICLDYYVEGHARQYVTTNSPVHRIVDRRSQALRKRGKLKYERILGWIIP